MSKLTEMADDLGITTENALQEWAARNAINTLNFMWQEWAVSLTKEEFVSDVNDVIKNLERWRDRVIAVGLVE